MLDSQRQTTNLHCQTESESLSSFADLYTQVHWTSRHCKKTLDGTHFWSREKKTKKQWDLYHFILLWRSYLLKVVKVYLLSYILCGTLHFNFTSEHNSAHRTWPILGPMLLHAVLRFLCNSSIPHRKYCMIQLRKFKFDKTNQKYSLMTEGLTELLLVTGKKCKHLYQGSNEWQLEADKQQGNCLCPVTQRNCSEKQGNLHPSCQNIIILCWKLRPNHRSISIQENKVSTRIECFAHHKFTHSNYQHCFNLASKLTKSMLISQIDLF